MARLMNDLGAARSPMLVLRMSMPSSESESEEDLSVELDMVVWRMFILCLFKRGRSPYHDDGGCLAGE